MSFSLTHLRLLVGQTGGPLPAVRSDYPKECAVDIMGDNLELKNWDGINDMEGVGLHSIVRKGIGIISMTGESESI